MLFYQTVDTEALELLKKLLAIELFDGLRLVGGTSMALQKGHRKSIDLDLFGSINAETFEINTELNELGSLTVLKNSKNIHVYLVNGIKVDIVQYPYAWLYPQIKADGLRLADCRDIAAMKLAAITGRGSKKDFIDLYFLLNNYTIAEMLDYYLAKYPDGSLFLVLKSLVYFEDAEEDEMPNMLFPIEWEKVKRRILKAYTDYTV